MGAGGLLVVAGSVLPWATGDVLSSGASVTGLEMIEGLATILMGLGIGLAGLLALASRDRPRTQSVAAVLAIICLAIVAYFFVTMAHRLEFLGQAVSRRWSVRRRNRQCRRPCRGVQDAAPARQLTPGTARRSRGLRVSYDRIAPWDPGDEVMAALRSDR